MNKDFFRKEDISKQIKSKLNELKELFEKLHSLVEVKPAFEIDGLGIYQTENGEHVSIVIDDKSSIYPFKGFSHSGEWCVWYRKNGNSAGHVIKGFNLIKKIRSFE